MSKRAEQIRRRLAAAPTLTGRQAALLDRIEDNRDRARRTDLLDATDRRYHDATGDAPGE